MRILFVSHYGLPHVGGVEIVVDAISRELRARGHEVEQVTSRVGTVERDPPASAGPSRGATVHRVPAWNVIERRTGLPYPLFGPGLVRVLRSRLACADVLHAHGFLFQPSVVALWLASRRAARMGAPARVLTEHGGRGDYPSRALRALESIAIATAGQISLRSAQVVIALNERIAAEMTELSPATRVLDLPNGVDTCRYRQASESERAELRARLGWDERPRVLFVGRFVPRKGAGLAVEAVRSLGDGARLVMVGPGAPPDLPSSVEVLGQLPPGRVSELYRAADCLVLPSVAEGFPLTVQQALASGLPVLVSDDPVYESYLGDAPEGVARVPRTVEAIAAALARLDCGRSLDAGSRSALAKFAESRYSTSAWVDRHEALYRELIQAARESRSLDRLDLA